MKKQTFKTKHHSHWVVSLLLLLLGGFCSNSIAQSNLIPNPDFEEYFDCIYEEEEDIKNVIPDWSAIHTSPRYRNNICFDNPASTYFQDSFYCQSVFGQGHILTILNPRAMGTPNIRHYLQTRLIDTLFPGRDYFISYFLTIPFPEENALSHYGIHFNNSFVEEDVTGGLPFINILLDPQIEIDTVPYLPYCQWTKFSHCFNVDSICTVMVVGVFAENEEILNTENISNSHTYVAYDNYFLAEIEEEIIIEDHPDTICVGDCITLSTNHSLIEGSFEWILPGSDIGNSQDSIVTVCYQTEGIFDIAVSAEHCTGRYDSLYSDALTVVAGISYSVPDSSICAGEEIILSVPNAYSVTWHDLSTSSSITLSDADTYTYEISNGHCSIVDSFSITYHTSPSLQLVEIFACVGDSTTYIDQTYSLPGMYQDTIMDMQGCDSIYFDIVFDYFEAEAIANESPYAFCTGQSVSVDLMSSSDYAISWTDGASTMPRVFDQAGTYHYQYTDDNLCLYSDSILINALDTPSIMTMDLLDIWFDGSVDIPVQYDGNIASYLWSDASPLSCADCP